MIYAWDRASDYSASAAASYSIAAMYSIEDARNKVIQSGCMNSVSKSISSKFGPNEGWLRSGFAPATAPNTGFFFCPSFKW